MGGDARRVSQDGVDFRSRAGSWTPAGLVEAENLHCGAERAGQHITEEREALMIRRARASDFNRYMIDKSLGRGEFEIHTSECVLNVGLA